jgi:hypothetical protein
MKCSDAGENYSTHDRCDERQRMESLDTPVVMHWSDFHPRVAAALIIARWTL